MSTSIDFGDDLGADLSSATLTAMLGWHISPRFGFDLGVGSVLTGEIDVGGVETSFDPGILGTITGSYLALYEGDVRPFVLVSLTVSVLTMTGDDNRFTAFDARAGLTVGKTFWERFTPYLAARVFGGPVSWDHRGQRRDRRRRAPLLGRRGGLVPAAETHRRLRRGIAAGRALPESRSWYRNLAAVDRLSHARMPLRFAAY